MPVLPGRTTKQNYQVVPPSSATDGCGDDGVMMDVVMVEPNSRSLGGDGDAAADFGVRVEKNRCGRWLE